jgi:hypothetical protein
MKNFTTAIVLTLSLVIFPQTSFAASRVTAKITAITVLAPYDAVYVTFDNHFSGDVVCGDTTSRAVLAGPALGMERIYSLLLTAKATGQSVKLTAVSCGVIYSDPAPKIWAAELL